VGENNAEIRQNALEKTGKGTSPEFKTSQRLKTKESKKRDLKGGIRGEKGGCHLGAHCRAANTGQTRTGRQRKEWGINKKDPLWAERMDA